MVLKTYTFVGQSANCDLTLNWAPLKSVAGQRLYTIQRRWPVSAKPHDKTAAARFVTNNYQRKSSVTALIKDLGWTDF